MKVPVIPGLLIVAGLLMSQCKKEKATPPVPFPAANPPSTAGTIKLVFDPIVNGSNMVAGTQTYTNQAANTYSVTMFKFYISNVKLTKFDNSVWSESNSYHLVDCSAGSATVKLSNVTFSNYKAIQFMIGVDSARNNSGAQTGDLDPSYGMFWTWNTGYIMAKMEGISPQSSATNHKLEFHIGGFSGAYSVLKTVSPSFNTDTAKVTSTTVPVIHLSADVGQWFNTPNTIDFSTTSTVNTPGANAKAVSDNYAGMFNVTHIYN